MSSVIRFQHAYGPQLLDQVLALRYVVLRAPHGLPPESAGFPNDDRPTTLHLLAYSQSDSPSELIGCVSLMFDESHPSNDSVQLRGMAVRTDCQRSGVGRSLLQAVHELGRTREVTFWCNARASAIGFYDRHGWQIDGPYFDIPVIGPHVVMRWTDPERSTGKG